MAATKNSTKKKRRIRRSFTPEFRADVVRLCQSGSESIAAVCQRLDLTESAVRIWLAKSARTAAAGSGKSALTTGEQEELQRLRRENKQLKMEREILKNHPGGRSDLFDEKLGSSYTRLGVGGAAGCFLETTAIPLKNMVQGL